MANESTPSSSIRDRSGIAYLLDSFSGGAVSNAGNSLRDLVWSNLSRLSPGLQQTVSAVWQRLPSFGPSLRAKLLINSVRMIEELAKRSGRSMPVGELVDVMKADYQDLALPISVLVSLDLADVEQDKYGTETIRLREDAALAIPAPR